MATVEILGSSGTVTTYNDGQQTTPFEVDCDEQLQHCLLTLLPKTLDIRQPQRANQVRVTLMQILKNTLQSQETTFALKGEATKALPKAQASAQLGPTQP